MALYAEAKEAFLRGFLKLEHGLPSHDTFSRLFRLLDPEQFRRRFSASWPICRALPRRGRGRRQGAAPLVRQASGKSALHMVSAWGCEQRLVLAQIATDAKSNEITAVPKLLEMLSLKGTIVTVDALNCQRAIAQQIVDQGGDYALALKGNQGTLHDDVDVFSDDPAVEGDHRRRSWTPIMAASRPDGHGLDRHRLAAGGASLARAGRHRQGGPRSAKPPTKPPPRPPIICSARRCLPNASTRSSAPIGASRTACIGASTSS